MENSTLSVALAGVVPAVCDAEAGDRHGSNVTVPQANPTTGAGSSTDSQCGEGLDQRPSAASAGENGAMIAVRGPGSERKKSGLDYHGTLTAGAGSPLDAQRMMAGVIELWGDRTMGQERWRRRASGIARLVRCC